jgi:hypothetical protein
MHDLNYREERALTIKYKLPRFTQGTQPQSDIVREVAFRPGRPTRLTNKCLKRDLYIPEKLLSAKLKG